MTNLDDKRFYARPTNTPDEVVERPWTWVEDPTIGIPVEPPGGPPARHRLVTIGDSITHGFQSGAIHLTNQSYAALVADHLGLDATTFRFPAYDGPGDGLPFNIEKALRLAEDWYGRLRGPEWLLVAVRLLRWLDAVEDYWERGDGSQVPADAPVNHNLGIYGWDLRDVMSKRPSPDQLPPPGDNIAEQLVENAGDRAAIRVLWPARREGKQPVTPLEAAHDLGADGGIETLIVFLGSNNALATVLHLEPKWTGDDYADPVAKNAYNVWRPSHFRAELEELVGMVEAVGARHVLWGTVPHVTIAPLARGLGKKVKERHHSAYFPVYTRPWVDEKAFDEALDPHLTGGEAQVIDWAVNAYNADILDVVRSHRHAGYDWRLVDLCGVLDGLAFRRYLTDPEAAPSGWKRYPLPEPLARRGLDTRFFRSNEDGILEGGLFSLDGVHPTTVAHGIIAAEVLRALPRDVDVPGGREVDFELLAQQDTLVSQPPCNLDAGLGLLAWFDQAWDIIRSVSPGRIRATTATGPTSSALAAIAGVSAKTAPPS